MESIQNIVITSQNENPARFVTSIDPVKIKTSSEMAVINLCHGEVFNVHSGNNKVYFYNFLTADRRFSLDMIKKLRGFPTDESVRLPNRAQLIMNPRMVAIPEGHYKSFLEICWAITNAIKESLKLTKRSNIINPSLDKHSNIIDIELFDKIFLVIKDKKDTPWGIMGVTEDHYRPFSIPNTTLDGSFPAFVYANIVENSYIDGKLSRNLGVIPIHNGNRWTFYQPATPNYMSINVMQFSKILIELRDENGDFIKFNPNLKTLITLCIRPVAIKRV
jgi:hypothetical protein